MNKNVFIQQLTINLNILYKCYGRQVHASLAPVLNYRRLARAGSKPYSLQLQLELKLLREYENLARHSARTRTHAVRENGGATKRVRQTSARILLRRQALRTRSSRVAPVAALSLALPLSLSLGGFDARRLRRRRRSTVAMAKRSGHGRTRMAREHP